MRDAETPGARRISHRRLVGSIVVIALGLVALLFGLFGGVGGSGGAALVGLGMVMMIFGVALLAPLLVRPLARVIGAPLQRLQGMPGRLARENAERQPQRTAITASALMIGLALVVFTAIFAAGLRGSIDKVIDDQLSKTALIVTHDDGFSPVPAGVVGAARQDARRRRRLADALRPGQRQGRRRLRAGLRRRPVHRHAALPARDRRRATCGRSPTCATTRSWPRRAGPRARASRSATRSRSRRRRARCCPTSSSACTTTRSGCSATSSSRTSR